MRAVEICDGVQVHLDWRRLQLSKEEGISICLRCPHTTHLTQGEDTVHFGVFKTLFERRKAEVLTAKRLGPGGGGGDPNAALVPNDFMTCAKDAWEQAFSEANVVSAWAKNGLWPFTMKPYWDLLQEERRLSSGRQVKADVRALGINAANVLGAGAAGSRPARTSREESEDGSVGEDEDVDAARGRQRECGHDAEQRKGVRPSGASCGGKISRFPGAK